MPLYPQEKGPIPIEQGNGSAQNHHIKHTNTPCGKMQTFSISKRAERIVTARFEVYTYLLAIQANLYFYKHNGLTITNALLGNQG